MASQRSFGQWLVLAAVVCLSPRWGRAQIAPTGAHYTARASDTGFEGPNESGGYSTSIPLELPAARGGLPIPVQIVSGGDRYRTLGLGWDLPFSYVFIDRTLAHRRPETDHPYPQNTAKPTQAVTLSLLGRNTDMVFRKSKGTWVGRTAPQLELRESAAGDMWTAYDGSGFKYFFTQHPNLIGTRGASTYPGTSGLWLLSRIEGGGRSALVLTYNVHVVTIPVPGVPPAVAIDLVNVAYNAHPSANCFKNEIQLSYEPTGAGKQFEAIDFIGSTIILRTTRLQEVRSTARASCSTGLTTLRRYAFKYTPDQTSQRDRLELVNLYGRDGTREAATPITMLRFQYGSPTTASATSGKPRVLAYDGTNVDLVDLSQAPYPGIARTQRASWIPFHSPVKAYPYPAATIQNIIDVTGDGRPDLVFEEAGALMIARNVPKGNSVEFAPKTKLNDTTFTQPFLDAHSFRYDRFKGPADSHYNEDLVWTQTIDVNGDGRLDVVDASAQQNHWVIYLNTPDATVASGIKWEKRSLNVTRLIDELIAKGWPLAHRYLPLSHRVTARNYKIEMCWVKKPDPNPNNEYEGHPEWVRIAGHNDCNRLPPNPDFNNEPETTIDEWKLEDINGDGYPDFVFQDRPAWFKALPHIAYWPFPDEEYGFQELIFGIHEPANLRAAYNTRGVFLATGSLPNDPDGFTATFELVRGTRCGVEAWHGNKGADGKPVGTQSLECGFADFNGDRIADRFDDSTVLGNGVDFNGMRIPTSTVGFQITDYKEHCEKKPVPDTWYAASKIAAVRDVTGDGVPDQIRGTPRITNASWSMAPGGAAGIEPEHGIDIEGHFELSRIDESCDGTESRTASGLLDIDGDGLPEVVTLTNTGKLAISALRDGATVGRPAAGRLTSIATPLGATTMITYRSAKTDTLTLSMNNFGEA